MGIGASIFLIAAGAILAFAVETTVSGIDIDAVGIILVVCGIVGLVLTLTIWGPEARAGRRTVVRDTTVRDDTLI